jgi:protein TonB
MKTKLTSICAALMLLSSSLVHAAEVSPVIDSKSCDAPKYPKSALMNEETGTVVLGYLIGADGKVMDSRVDKTSGSKALDKAALTALALCKFKPGNKDGKVEQMWTKVEFVWKLE